MDFGHRHYVPILKTKMERDGLIPFRRVNDQYLSPLLELHPHKKNPIGTHVEETCEALEAAWGNERELFLDTLWLHQGKRVSSYIKSRVIHRDSDVFGLRATSPSGNTCCQTCLQGIFS